MDIQNTRIYWSLSQVLTYARTADEQTVCQRFLEFATSTKTFLSKSTQVCQRERVACTIDSYFSRSKTAYFLCVISNRKNMTSLETFTTSARRQTTALPVVHRWRHHVGVVSSLVLVVWMALVDPVASFVPKSAAPASCWYRAAPSKREDPLVVLFGYENNGREGYSRSNTNAGYGLGVAVKSKRQERVGQLVHTELSRILHNGVVKGQNVDFIEEGLQCRISVVRADVSPDLRQARISVSIRPNNTNNNKFSNDDTLKNDSLVAQDVDDDDEEDDDYMNEKDDDRREAHAWLVRNTNAIRHTVSQRMSHIKSSCPALTFIAVDVTAAVDVMHLIDQVSAASSNSMKRGVDWNPEDIARDMMMRGSRSSKNSNDDDDDIFDDDDDDDDEWEETNADFFKSTK